MKNIFYKSPFSEPEFAPEQKFMVHFLSSGAIIAFTFFGILYFAMGLIDKGIHNTVTAFFISLSYSLYIFTKFKTFPINLTFSFITLSLISLIVQLGGISTPFIVWFALLIVGANFVFTSKGFVIWSTLILLGFALIEPLRSLPFTLPYQVELSHNELMIIATCTFLALAFSLLTLLVFFSGRMFNRLKEIREHREDLVTLIRTLGHDVNNMVHCIQLATSLLEMKSDSPEIVKKYAKQIKSNGHLISELISKIKTYEALKSGKLTIEKQVIIVSALVEKIETVFLLRCEEKNIKLFIKNNIHEDFKILSDEKVLFYEIISNILSNAIKFSEKESIIEIFIADSPVEKTLTITIRDRGIGIPKEILEHLFSFHHLTSRKGTSNEAGTGFGMPLVKKYIELLSGKLIIKSKTKEESPTDHGTEFVITLPQTFTSSTL